uniref:Uncharacterized protein n=1 Tax=Siphoviridae sp. ctbbV81 TaxID=2827900 RepID=A0A8S5TQP7_9CAUD|nr:MAG TPA: hypothetical protein [Siphoviridae sp. ctbbV81]
MSKSVLIMNTPKGCFACPFHMADFNFNLCLATRNDSIRTISKVSHEGFKKLAGRPDWCPLKPLPEKMTGVVLTEHWGGVKKGWNGCIDAITGGNVDDEFSK